MNKLFLMLLAAASLVRAAAPAAAADPAGAPVLHLVFDLSDGSRVIGIPSIDRLKVATQYADLEVQLSQVRTVEFSAENHTAKLSLQNGDLLNGRLAATEIAAKTIFGPVTVPLAQVRRMQVAVSGGPLPEGLVLHYTFNKDEGGKVTDASGNGNDGEVRGATYAKDGKNGGAMSFNGDREAVIIKNSAGLQLQDFTILLWIKRGDKDKLTNDPGFGPGANLFGYGQAGYGLFISDKNLLGLSKMGFDGVTSKCEIVDDAWHHVGVAKKGSKVVFYMDGVAYPAADYDPGFTFNTVVAAGARADTLDNSFLGLISEVAVFNRALTDDEVKEIYDSQK